jgi:hypothetical protein
MDLFVYAVNLPYWVVTGIRSLRNRCSQIRGLELDLR